MSALNYDLALSNHHQKDMSTTRRGFIKTSISIAALVTYPLSPQANSTWPTRPIKIIVPVPAGGSLDILARTVAKGLTEKLGQSVIVENMAGGGSNIAFGYVAKAAPDGYTLLVGWDSLVINPALYPSLPYKLDQFAPITLAITAPQVLVVGPKLPVKNLKTFIELARRDPGSISLANAGNGSPGHLAGSLLESRANIQFTNIPYKGGAPAVVDLVAGHVDSLMVTLPAAIQHIRSGRLTALGISSSKRSTGAPEIPTIAEAGLPGYDLNSWQGFLAPTGTPNLIVNLLNKEIVGILKDPEVKRQLISEGFEVIASSPKTLADYLTSSTPKWAKLVKDSGAKVD
jgi:tripartite-type tricarboxylate transporter receptor subunit TctC